MALRLINTRLGSLTARIVEDDAAVAPDLVVVLCHGYGAPGDDLVSLAPEILQRDPALASRVRFIFPEAPLALDDVPFGGRAWWPIDMVQLQRRMVEGTVGAMMDETPAGLAEARRHLLSMLEALQRQTKLPLSRVVLGGFSQGAMLATDVALRLDEAPAALVVLSGALISKAQWRTQAARRAGLTVLQSHGTRDPILPYAGAKALEALLLDAGMKVQLTTFAGGHGIDGVVVAALSDLVAAKLASTSSPSSTSTSSSSLSPSSTSAAEAPPTDADR
jgi:phospholipase/carboxylesterase